MQGMAALGFVLLGSAICGSVVAQALTPPTGGPYVLRKQAIAGGGQRAVEGPYALTGTLGQAPVDPTAATAENYRLVGGFLTPELQLSGSSGLDDAVAWWRFADNTDSNGGESNFNLSGDFTVGNPVSIIEPLVFSANGLAASEGADSECVGFGERFIEPGHELALTANGSMTVWARVRFGAFDGVDDVARMGDAFWTDSATWELDFVNGQPRFAVTGLDQEKETHVLSPQVLSTQTWYDLTGGFDAQAGAIRLVVHDTESGQLIGSPSVQAVSFSSLAFPGSVNLLFLESPSNANGCNQGAQLESAAVWNKVLSLAEISALSPQDIIFADDFKN